MKPAVKWMSGGAALLALLLSLIFPQAGTPTLIFALLSLAAAAACRVHWLAWAELAPAFLIGAYAAYVEPSLLAPCAVALALALQVRARYFRRTAYATLANVRVGQELRSVLPAKALVFVDVDIESETPLDSLREGHLVHIHPGDTIPADGQVTYGSSFVDEIRLNGVPEPRAVSMGSPVYAGTINKNGSFLFRVSKLPQQSQLALLWSQLEKTDGPKPPPVFYWMQMVIAPLALLALLFLRPPAAFNLLLVSLGSTLVAFRWGRAALLRKRSSQAGIAWAGEEAVRACAEADVVVSGSPGVLTEGRLKVSAVQGGDSLSEDGVLALLGPLARRLETAAAFGLLQEMQARNIRLGVLETYEEIPTGAIGLVSGEEVEWRQSGMGASALPSGPLSDFVATSEGAGQCVVLLFRNSQPSGAVAFGEKVRTGAKRELTDLHREGLPFILVSPLPAQALEKLGQELGLSHLHGSCSRLEVQALLDRMRSEHLQPLWVQGPEWTVRHPGAVLASAASALEEAPKSARLLQLDLKNILQALRLARLFPDLRSRPTPLEIVAQLAMALTCFKADPRLAALALFVPAWLFSAREKQL